VLFYRGNIIPFEETNLDDRPKTGEKNFIVTREKIFTEGWPLSEGGWPRPEVLTPKKRGGTIFLVRRKRRGGTGDFLACEGKLI